MFKKRKKVDLNQTDTLIGQETTMEGQLRSQASVRIEGEIQGDIHCEGDCIIGESGHAQSNVRARNISIAGKVSGDVVAEGTLTILTTGTLLGDCQAATLVIEEGGLFNGRSQMQGKDASPSADHRLATETGKNKGEDTPPEKTKMAT